jgi:hypothetical protein
MKRLILLVLLITTSHLHAQQRTLPTWFTQSFIQNKLNEKYELKSYLKPTFLEADFNGDGAKDVATIVTEKKTRKGGILLIHGNTNQWFVFGAGTNFGNGSTDFFNWMKRWKVYRNKVVEETTFDKNDDITGSRVVKLKRPGIEVLMLEAIDEPSPVAVIYWNGKKYIWIHEGE